MSFKNPTPVAINGWTFPSLTKAAAHFGLPVATLHSRIVRGTTLEEALTAKKQQRRAPPSCKAGHLFTPENTRLYRNKKGSTIRICRACTLERHHRHQLKLAHREFEEARQRSSHDEASLSP